MSYLLFEMDAYYPEGGFNDFAGHFATVELARECFHNGREVSPGYVYKADFGHIVDRDTLEVVERLWKEE